MEYLKNTRLVYGLHRIPKGIRHKHQQHPTSPILTYRQTCYPESYNLTPTLNPKYPYKGQHPLAQFASQTGEFAIRKQISKPSKAILTCLDSQTKIPPKLSNMVLLLLLLQPQPYSTFGHLTRSDAHEVRTPKTRRFSQVAIRITLPEIELLSTPCSKITQP